MHFKFSLTLSIICLIYFGKWIFFILLRTMRIVPDRILFIIFALLLNSGVVVADNPGPPPPTGPVPPPPPGLPLDGCIYMVLLLSICYGIYKLNKIKNIKKASN